MSRDDVIRMAREAGIVFDDKAAPFYERFAALVATHVRETEFKPDWMNYQQGLADGAAAEREVCAKVCEDGPERQQSDGTWIVDHYACAAAIRARGETSSRGQA